MKFYRLPCQTKLNLLLSYDKETGVLTWRQSARPGYGPGDVAGCIPKGKPYHIVRIEGRGFYAQRLIWKMVTGRDPVSGIDHADGDHSNNKWNNLREADPSQNGYNRKINRNNRSGVKGITWEASHKSWKAVITVNRRPIRLGRFKNIDDAVREIEAARLRLHGEFARAA